MNTHTNSSPGGCLCGEIRFEIHGEPLIVHACHCSLCQRRTGAAFAVNIWIETDRIRLLSGEPEARGAPGIKPDEPSTSWFCPYCGTCLWSHFYAAPAKSRFVRLGTLDDPATFAPDVHIFAASRLPFVAIPEGVPVFEGFYKLKETWSDESRARLRAMLGG